MSDYNSITAREGVGYNLLDPNEYLTVVRFRYRADAPTGLQESFLVNPDYLSASEISDESPYEAAVQLQKALNRYLLNSDQERIKPVVAYLEAHEKADMVAMLTNRRNGLLAEVARLDDRISLWMARLLISREVKQL